MNRETQTTVTKCPACGKVTIGLPPSCPACNHRFADLDKNLPVVREPTQEFSSRSLRDLTEETRPRAPRHVVVPLLAGLLVAVVVIVIVRLAGSGGSVTEPTRKRIGTAPAHHTGDPAAIHTLDAHGSTPEPTGLLPQLGPETHKVLAIDITADQGSEDHLALLTDGSPMPCLFPGRGRDPHTLRATFEGARRFSHVLIHVACPPTDSHVSEARARIITDDGTTRESPIPAVPGRVWVDLAGAWTSQIVLDFSAPGFEHIGLGELEFFTFSDE